MCPTVPRQPCGCHKQKNQHIPSSSEQTFLWCWIQVLIYTVFMSIHVFWPCVVFCRSVCAIISTGVWEIWRKTSYCCVTTPRPSTWRDLRCASGMWSRATGIHVTAYGSTWNPHTMMPPANDCEMLMWLMLCLFAIDIWGLDCSQVCVWECTTKDCHWWWGETGQHCHPWWRRSRQSVGFISRWDPAIVTSK